MKLEKDSLAAWDPEKPCVESLSRHILDNGRQLFARYPPEGFICRPFKVDKNNVVGLQRLSSKPAL